MKIGLNIISPGWCPWMWSFEIGTHESSEAINFLKVTKEIEFAKPDADFRYPSVKYPFKWDKAQGAHAVKVHNGKPIVDIELFLEHPQISPLLDNGTGVVDQILYFDKVGGKEISEEVAIANSKDIDLDKKPAPTRPGKRKAPDQTPPATPSKP